jgi:hypothetical protein
VDSKIPSCCASACAHTSHAFTPDAHGAGDSIRTAPCARRALRPSTQACSPRRMSAVTSRLHFLAYIFRCQCTRAFVADAHVGEPVLWAAVAPSIQIVLSHPNGWEGAQQSKMRRAVACTGLISDTDTSLWRRHMLCCARALARCHAVLRPQRHRAAPARLARHAAACGHTACSHGRGAAPARKRALAGTRRSSGCPHLRHSCAPRRLRATEQATQAYPRCTRARARA